MPMEDRAEMCGATIGDSIFSRFRRQEDEDKQNKNVHWKLRNTAKEVAEEFRHRVDVSFSAAMDTVAKNIVKKAKDKITRASVQYRSIDRGLRGQGSAIESGLDKAVVKNVKQSAANGFRRQQVDLMNRLAELR